MKALTSLVKVHKKLEKMGFVVLALHFDPGGSESETEVLYTAMKNKWTHAVYYKGNLKNFKLATPPQVFIFDHDGRMVYDPKGGIDFTKDANRYAGKAPSWLLGGQEFKALSKEADKIGSLKDLAKLYPELQEKSKSATGKEKEEALALVERIEWYVAWMKRRIETKAADGFPAGSMDAAEELAKVFDGHAIGEEADKLVKERKADKAFKNELNAEKKAKAVEKAIFSIDPSGRGDDPEKWMKRNARNIGKAKKGLADLMKKYADTAVVKRLQTIIAALGIN